MEIIEYTTADIEEIELSESDTKSVFAIDDPFVAPSPALVDPWALNYCK